jgi:hypothetical protein
MPKQPIPEQTIPATGPTTDPTAPPYDPDAIFHRNGPFDPRCVEQAVCTIIRCTPLDPTEPASYASRRMYCAMRALAALHPRDEIEIMLGVQAVCAYHAAAACWRLNANPRLSDSDKSRHISKVATAVRTFDTTLRAIERRQAKPLSIPVGRPEPQAWELVDTDALAKGVYRRFNLGEDQPGPAPTPEETETMTDDEIVTAWLRTHPNPFENEHEGLDLANTEAIRPGGGMIMPEDPTPRQVAYIQRRLMLGYVRERQQNQRNGIDKKIVFRPLRPGDLIT